MAEKMTKYKAEKALGLTGSYSFKDFTSAYRKMVKKNHPDMGGSEEKMIEINNAKEYLEGFFKDDKDAVITCSATDSFSSSTTYANGTYARTPYTNTAENTWNAKTATDATDANWSEDFTNFVDDWADSYASSRAKSEKADEDERRAKFRKAAYNATVNTVKTKYGWVSADGHPDWPGVVGVPYEYSAIDNQYKWERINAEAEDMARVVNGMGKTASATGSAANANDFVYQAAYAATSAAVNAAANAAASSKASGGWFSSYKRADIEGAPKWWKAANWMASKFQWRITFWIVMIVITQVVLSNAGYSMTAGEALIVTGCAFASVLNVFGIFTSPIRRLVRKTADANLVKWAAKRGWKVDWDASCLVK